MGATKRFMCEGCHRERPGNSRLKPGQQRFCSSKTCQRKRRALWYRETCATDPGFREEQAQAKRDWRRSDAGMAYDREYKRRRRSRAETSTAGLPRQADPAPRGDPRSGRYALRSLEEPDRPEVVVELIFVPGTGRSEQVGESVQDRRVAPG